MPATARVCSLFLFLGISGLELRQRVEVHVIVRASTSSGSGPILSHRHWHLFPVNLKPKCVGTGVKRNSPCMSVIGVGHICRRCVRWSGLPTEGIGRKGGCALPAALILFAVCLRYFLSRLGRVSLGLRGSTIASIHDGELLMLVAIARILWVPNTSAAHADKRAWLSVVIPKR